MKQLICSAALCLGIAAPQAMAASIDEIYVFGDSLNDCCINPQAPFTNDSVTWLVEFAGLIGASYTESTAVNYATGGAQSGEFNAIAPGGATQPNGLQSQIDQFEADAPAVDGDDLAVIWVGTNDIWASSYDGSTLFGLPGLDVVKPLGDDPSAQALTSYITGNIQDAVVDLRDAGFGSVLLLTPYDIGDSALFDSAGGPAQNTAYSESLAEAMLSLYTPGINTFVLDVVALIRELQDIRRVEQLTLAGELVVRPEIAVGREVLIKGMIEVSGKRDKPQTEKNELGLPIIGTFQQDLYVVLQDGKNLRVAEVPDPDGGTISIDIRADVLKK